MSSKNADPQNVPNMTSSLKKSNQPPVRYGLQKKANGSIQSVLPSTDPHMSIGW